MEVLSLLDRRRCLIRLGGVLDVSGSHLSLAPVLFSSPGSLATATASATASAGLASVRLVTSLSRLVATSEAAAASTESAALSPRRIVILVVVLFLHDGESFIIGPLLPEATVATATTVASASEATSLTLLVTKKAGLLFLLSFLGSSRSFFSR